MTGRGRHARSNGPGFYRDVLLLLAGIIVVAAVVFGGLSLWAGGSDDDITTPGSPTSTERADTTDISPTTPTTPASTAPTTTIAPTTAEPSTTGTAAAPTTLREARDPAEVRAIVLNSTGIAGLAGQLSDELAQQGYQMAQADNYTPELSDSMIFHADGSSVEALNLAETMPDATVAPDPELAAEWGVDVVVVIGQSYTE